MKKSLTTRIKKIISQDAQGPKGGLRAKIISVSNQKGGVGKTTTSVNLAAGLSMIKKRRVLLMDLDSQGHVTVSLGSTMATAGIIAVL